MVRRPPIGNRFQPLAVDFGRKKKEMKREKNTSRTLLFPGSPVWSVAMGGGSRHGVDAHLGLTTSPAFETPRRPKIGTLIQDFARASIPSKRAPLPFPPLPQEEETPRSTARNGEEVRGRKEEKGERERRESKGKGNAR
ncbi:hypothetical protein BHE74_00009002 [Ensete ventricosum]|nr:hypothetical protein BHE74_00009002 [Ensete ventricosum]